MATTEQPPKKRRPPYEPSQQPEQPPPSSPPPPASAEPQPPPTQTIPNAPFTPFTPEEISQKRRNQEEICGFYESFKLLKHCISQKDAHLMPELEQSYLALITSARGCMSVQRLVAEFVPKYASYCPTALEAAVQVCINIHNSTIAIIKQNDGDADDFTLLTAKLSIFGLATICEAASSQTPTSSVIQGICSAVFRNVLNSYISSLEGQEIFQIVNKDVLKIYDCPNMYSDFKKKFADNDDTVPVKLSKFRALCILWIFFRCPRNSLEACFELCGSSSTDAGFNGGQYFLNQVTASFDTWDDDSKSCLLGLVLEKDPSLKQWIFSRVKNISKSASPDVMSSITSAFERIFDSFTEQMKAHDKQVEIDVDNQLSALHLEKETSPNNSGGQKSMDLDPIDHRELSRASSSTPNTVRASSSTPNTVRASSSTPNNDVPAHLPSWHCDGDRAAMDIYSASRHLWLGSLGPDASEPLVRFQFERFGPIDKFLYISFKQFAVIEYNNIMDAIKAREVMRGRSPWGSCLIIKFLDIGLGTRGDIHGVTVGSCCHVYVGNIYSQLDKDEILYELRKVGFKGPLAVTDLISEGALLMEFGTPEEAAAVMAHLRQYRREKRDFFQSPGVGSMHVDVRNNNLGNVNVSSPHGQTAVGFSHYGQHNTNTMELTSPRMNMQNQGYPYQAGGHVNATPIHGHNYPPSQPIQPSSYMRPMYYPPNNSWDPHGMIHHNHAVAPPPYIPASVTPLAQLQVNPLPHHDQMFYAPPHQNMPPPLPPHQNMPPPFPFHPEFPPPLPPSPPPTLEFQPPPPPPMESSMVGGRGYWQGTLSKSGVHYSTIHARRLHSDACNYGDNNISEPADWPTKLDITKRTDFRHVMSTFSSTPPHKREVCQLLPASTSDHKGFQDFISYLKQRECAGVIKIPATKTIWARLLFILPHSNDTCSHLSVAPDTVDCLIALILPKETNFEWV